LQRTGVPDPARSEQPASRQRAARVE
jgi:hypothetical protein